MLCCQSVRAMPLTMYKERRLTVSEIIVFRFCFAFSYGRKRKTESDKREMPAMISKGGASLCQLITEPAGYSVNNNSANARGDNERNFATLSIRKLKAAGMSFPLDRDRLSKLQSWPKLATFLFASKPWKLKLCNSCFLTELISSFSSFCEMKSSMYWKPSGQLGSKGNNVFIN